MAVIQARLDLEPADAVRYFASKGEALAWDHTDVWREVNARSFTVAKAMTLDIQRTIQAEVARAIGPGQTLEEFKRRLRHRLQDLGWWGTREVPDPDGNLVRVQLGSHRRLRTIYQTNVQTAYMAGRYKRYLDNVADRPYWRYVAIMDSRTRPAHAELDGKVFRWDDPIWEIIWPPNGWGCRCRIVALTEAEFRALGVPLENGRDHIVEREAIINKAGDTATVKGFRYRDENGREHTFWPDPGWDYNPGAAGAWGDELAQLVERKQLALDRAVAEVGERVRTAVRRLETVDDFIEAGRTITALLPDGGATPMACYQALLDRLKRDVGIDMPCKVASRSAGAKLVQEASRRFPDSWTAVADQLGPLFVKARQGARGWQYSELRDPLYAGARLRLPDFGTVEWQQGAGYMLVRQGDVGNAVHEFAHRLQAALPTLDSLFAELHRRRTAGDPLESLRDITGRHYRANEVARKDKYVTPYQGKEYDGRPLEVMTVALETILGEQDAGEGFRSLYNRDREMFDFVVGLLFHWKP